MKYIYFDSTGNITLTIPVYVQENANDYGGIQGTITVDDNGNIFNIKASVFDKNTASSNGGAIDLVAGTANISENTSFTQNSASYRGGAVYMAATKDTGMYIGNDESRNECGASQFFPWHP